MKEKKLKKALEIPRNGWEVFSSLKSLLNRLQPGLFLYTITLTSPYNPFSPVGNTHTGTHAGAIDISVNGSFPPPSELQGGHMYIRVESLVMGDL